jgi:dethiobiotin synthetase
MGSKARTVVITGTGTEIGKTHVAAALLAAWGRNHRVLGYKPIETGVRPSRRGGGPPAGEDSRALEEASTFHVKHRPFCHRYPDPVSPHLAARRAGQRIDIERITRQATALAQVADGLVVELAGGLFTPIGPGVFNADLVLRLGPDDVLLVAPDRLGVLHDVGATLRAARAMGLDVRGVVLSAPAKRDPSTDTNGEEIARALGAPVLAVFPRAGSRSRRTVAAAQKLAHELDLTNESASGREVGTHRRPSQPPVRTRRGRGEGRS